MEIFTAPNIPLTLQDELWQYIPITTFTPPIPLRTPTPPRTPEEKNTTHFHTCSFFPDKWIRPRKPYPTTGAANITRKGEGKKALCHKSAGNKKTLQKARNCVKRE